MAKKAKLKQLSIQERRFADLVLSGYQKARAARDAGYAENSARQSAQEIYNRPHVKKYIETRLEERSITAAETTKIISDIASSNIADYFVPTMVVEVPKVKKGLAQIIEEYRLHIIDEEEFAEEKCYTEKEYDKFQEGLQSYRDRIIRFKIELKRNPDAYRIVDGEPELVERQELDINALIADKERGKIKSVKYVKGELQVEGYSALDAGKEIAKMHGLYEKDNKQKEESVKQYIIIGGKEIEF